MASEQLQSQPSLTPIAVSLGLIPVGLKEAALDSPTFRATAIHFGEQIDHISAWLENYVRSASRLSSEVSSLEALVNTFLAASAPPSQISEAVLDHDYTVLALKRYGEGAREYWASLLKGIKKVDASIVDPIRGFLRGELKGLKDAQRILDQNQKQFDSLLARFMGLSKTKEASSLREDAFQLHEAKKSYLKAAMDFSVMAPQVRASLDKILVKIFSEQWRDMKASRETALPAFNKSSVEMDRIRGWSREMEEGERVFKRELATARKQLEESAEYAVRPSRELDDYAISTVPYLGTQGPSTGNILSPTLPPSGSEKSEKQGWLFQRTVTGKPARTLWVRRWFFVKNGIFGWLMQSPRSGAVEESEKTGVLLCGVRAAFQEERRFCFEVKTKDTSVILQAEMQSELMEWLASFESAKRKALKSPGSSESSPGSIHADAAFAITPAVAPEFAAKNSETSHGGDELSPDHRAATFGGDGLGSLATRSSVDVSNRRSVVDREGENPRDHAARIMQKLDLHRKSTAGPQASGSPSGSGIASLISASHQMLPVPQQPTVSADISAFIAKTMPASTLAPSTLANPPAPTNLSRQAVVVSNERGSELGKAEGGIPGGLLANLWGTNNWGYVNRLERDETKSTHQRSVSQPPSPLIQPSPAPSDALGMEGPSDSGNPSPGTMSPNPIAHRKTISLITDAASLQKTPPTDEYPNYYPLQLKAQDAQFRMLFPQVHRSEKLVLVFRATWNPNDQQEFPGRVYVTAKDIYFFSHHLGLVLITGVSLATISEVTAAPGRDCDFLYLHFRDVARTDGATRLTIKTFLEPLKLLQRRLNYLVHNCNAEEPAPLEEVIKRLIKLEDDNTGSPSQESWEEIDPNTPADGGWERSGRDVKAQLRIDGNLYRAATAHANKLPTRFMLPKEPVVHAPVGMTLSDAVATKEYNISAKALFHVMFGDKSALFQCLYCRAYSGAVIQAPWVQVEQGHHRREFHYQLSAFANPIEAIDAQIIDVLSDHLLYVVTDKHVPWNLPRARHFSQQLKIVITHVAKSRCKLALFTKTEWYGRKRLSRSLIDRQARRDMDIYARDVLDTVTEQVLRLGANSGTNKVIQIFGQIGQTTTSSSLSSADIPPATRETRLKLRVHSVASLSAEAAADAVLTVLSTVLSTVGEVLVEVFNQLSVRRLLSLLLIGSLFANFFYTSREGWDWWRERNAAAFMKRLGVGPNAVVGHAVWLKDLDQMIIPNGLGVQLDTGGEEGRCYQTFQQLVGQSDPAEDVPPFSSSSSMSGSRRMATRLHRTRQSLGSYRHDLLVALRLVNRVEKEVLQSEWEQWAVEEAGRCRAVGRALSGRNQTDNVDRERLEWWESYCGSCLREVEGLGVE